MNLSRNIASAIGTLLLVTVVGFEMPVQDQLAPPPSCSIKVKSVTCVQQAKGKQIYTVTAVVTSTFGCLTTVAITPSSGTAVPGSVPGVSSGSTIFFDLVGVVGQPTLSLTMSGCGKTCQFTGTLPPLAQIPCSTAPCLSLSVVNVVCIGSQNSSQCVYAVTLNVISTTSGTLSISGPITLTSSAAIVPGVNTITGNLFVPCGATSTSLTATLPGTSCSASVKVPLPGCQLGCLTLSVRSLTCSGSSGSQCQYAFTLQVLSIVAGGLTISSSVGTVAPASSTIVIGLNTINGTLTVPCGTTSATLTGQILWAAGICQNSVSVTLPPCGPCLVLSAPQVSCAGATTSQCQYTIVLSVVKNSPGSGTVALSSSSGTVTPSSFTVNSGANGITVVLTAPCASSVTLTAFLSGTNCSETINVPLPCCPINAVATNSSLCQGGATTITLVPTPPAGTAVAWYSSPAPCPTSPPPASAWTLLTASGGTTWYTLALNQTTCFGAVVNIPGCPPQHPVTTVTVSAPCSGSISCSLSGGGACSTQVCSGTTVVLTFNSTSSGCNLQWQESTDGGVSWQPAGTTASITETLTSLTGVCSRQILFRVTCSCGACPPLLQQIDFQVYEPTVVPTLTAARTTLCAGDDTTLTLSGVCPGDQIQWRESTDGGITFNNITGATGCTTWNTNPLTQDTSYQVSVQNGPCAPALSNPVAITVNHPPTVSVSPAGPLTFCFPHPILLTATASATPPATCQWYLNGLPIPGATGPTVSATQTGYYWDVCTNACGSTQSNIVHLVEEQIVVAFACPAPCGVCPGSCVTLTAVPTSGSGSYTCLWTASPGPAPTPANTCTVTVCPTVTTTYTVTVTDTAAPHCTGTASWTIQICPNGPPICRLAPPELPRSIAAASAALLPPDENLDGSSIAPEPAIYWYGNGEKRLVDFLLRHREYFILSPDKLAAGHPAGGYSACRSETPASDLPGLKSISNRGG